MGNHGMKNLLLNLDIHWKEESQIGFQAHSDILYTQYLIFKIKSMKSLKEYQAIQEKKKKKKKFQVVQDIFNMKAFFQTVALFLAIFFIIFYLIFGICIKSNDPGKYFSAFIVFGFINILIIIFLFIQKEKIKMFKIRVITYLILIIIYIWLFSSLETNDIKSFFPQRQVIMFQTQL